VGPGLLAGLTYGVLQYLQGGWFANVWQFALDYLLAFAALGLAGLAKHWPKKWGLYAAMAIAALGRALSATLAGIVFWDTAPWASLVYNGTYLIPDTLICMLLALLIGETRRGKGFFRTAAYLPNMLPGLAVIILWSAFFSGEKSGVLNILLGRLGIPAQSYLTRAEWVIPVIIVIATWKGAGATALIYMAGMSSISPELYEAAAIDGASVPQRIVHILLPSIRKLAGTLLILQIISVFQIMYEPMVLTKGGPDNASLSLMQLMWQYAFGGSMNYGKASAVAVIVTLILLVMTAIYSFLNRKESDWD
jgi:multiple sugar transport system permease protein